MQAQQQLRLWARLPPTGDLFTSTYWNWRNGGREQVHIGLDSLCACQASMILHTFAAHSNALRLRLNESWIVDYHWQSLPRKKNKLRPSVLTWTCCRRVKFLSTCWLASMMGALTSETISATCVTQSKRRKQAVVFHRSLNEKRWKRSDVTHNLYASVIIRDECEQFLSEQEDQRRGCLWQSQHLLQHGQNTLPAKTKRNWLRTVEW